MAYNFRMISAIVLAAGLSSRMHKNKLLLPYRGKPIVEHVVRALENSQVGEMVIVIGHEAEKIREALRDYSVKWVLNEQYSKGMSSSLKAGVQAISSSAEGMLISLGDQPLVSAAEIDLLIDAFKQSGKKIIVPVFEAKRGNPVLFHCQYKEEMMKIQGDKGGRDLLKTNAAEVFAVEMPTDHVLRDIDLPADYEKIGK